jgi:capsid protein
MGGYADHKRVGLHTVAAGYLVPYELLTGDLSMVNFSSARVGLVEFRRLATSIYWLCLVPMMLDRVWRWFCEAAELAGELPTSDIPVEWPDLEFESVNPIDDANAELLRMRMGTMTWDEVVSSRGRSPDDVMREMGGPIKRFDEEGFVFDMDPRKVSRAGLTQGRSPGTELPNTDPEKSQQAQEAGRLGHLRQVK